MSETDIPLCVDLDGTLIKNDSVFAAFSMLFKRRPLFAIFLLVCFFKNMPQFKMHVCKDLDPKYLNLIYSDNFLEYLKSEYNKGRQIILITASYQKIANYVAENLGLFSEVIASDDKVNMKGKNKTRILNNKFGIKNYDYAGNHRVDKHVWKDARHAILVNANWWLRQYAKKKYTVLSIF